MGYVLCIIYVKTRIHPSKHPYYIPSMYAGFLHACMHGAGWLVRQRTLARWTVGWALSMMLFSMVLYFIQSRR